MTATPFDPLILADIQQVRGSTHGDNSERLQRLYAHLPEAIRQELTPRQQEILHMRFTENMRIVDIAAALDVDKSTVSRTLSRATKKLYRTLRYSL